jgi:hypothetical protein
MWLYLGMTFKRINYRAQELLWQGLPSAIIGVNLLVREEKERQYLPASMRTSAMT